MSMRIFRLPGGPLVPDEITMAIATTLATKGAEALVAGTHSALSALARLIRARFARDPQSAAVIDGAEHGDQDAQAHAHLAEALTQAMAHDPEFADHVRALWRKASAELSVGPDSVVNKFSGAADKVVQARDIHGNISF